MQTEAAAFPPKGKATVVSRALQDLVPISSQIVDHRGKPVALSMAGFVLHARRKYRLRIITPADEDLLGIQMISSPDFLKVDREVLTRDDQGRQVHDIPFRVHFDLGVSTYLLGNIRCDELEVHLRFKPESGKDAPPCKYPIVVRLGIWLALAGILVSLLAPFVPVLMEVRFADQATKSGDFWTELQEWWTDGRFWFVAIIVLTIVVVIYSISFLRLYYRSKELTEQFREQYPSAKRILQAQ
jgi:hypothetical protein